MPDNVVYCPFSSNGKLLAQAAGIGGGRCRLPNTTTTLHDVEGTLHIVAHCHAGSPYLSSTVDGREKIHVEQLARDLKEMRLGPTCTKIELMACEGGAAGPNGASSFASKLQNELRTKHELTDIVVEGFSLSVATLSGTGKGAGQGVVGASSSVEQAGRNAQARRHPKSPRK